MNNAAFYERVKDETDILDVAEYFDLDCVAKGGRTYVKCPEHLKNTGHEDMNIGNCVLYENGYHCFACGGHGDTISLIANHLRISYYDAACQIACAFGIPITGEYNYLPLNHKELDALHLVPAAKALVPLSYGDKCNGRFDGQGYVHYEKHTENLADLYKEDKRTFINIVRGKVAEWTPVYEQGIRDLTAFLMKNEPDMALLREFEAEKATLRTLNNINFRITQGMM